MKAFDYEWMIGRPWGLAHPDHICFADENEVAVSGGRLKLGISLNPKEFDGKKYPWGVGYVSSEDAFKYGIFDWRFRLPLGRHLWPALWLTDVKNWPPEIDALEGWSGYGLWPLQGRNDYLRLPWAQYIHPGIVHTNPAYTKGYGTCGKGVWRWQIRVNEINHCRLIWRPDCIIVEYNGHTIMDERREEILKAYNNSRGMRVVMNNYVENDFTYDDYVGLQRKEFAITDFKYQAL